MSPETPQITKEEAMRRLEEMQRRLDAADTGAREEEERLARAERGEDVEDDDNLDGGMWPPDVDATVRQAIESTPEADKEKIGWGIGSIGFKAEEIKDRLFINTFNTIGRGFIDQNSGAARFCRELKDHFSRQKKEAVKKAKDEKAFHDRKIGVGKLKVNISAGVQRQLSNVGSFSGNVIKYGRFLPEWLGISPSSIPRYVMAAGMATAVLSETGKEARLKGDEVREKTWILDADAAADEAWGIYNKALEREGKMEGDKVSDSEALKNAYRMRMPAELQKRLGDPSTANTFIQKILTKDLGYAIKKLNSDIEKIEKNSRLSETEKETQKEQLLTRQRKNIEDYDRIITQAGTVDGIAMALRYGQTAGKTAVTAMQVETVTIQVTKLWGLLSHALSSPDAHEAVKAAQAVGKNKLASSNTNTGAQGLSKELSRGRSTVGSPTDTDVRVGASGTANAGNMPTGRGPAPTIGSRVGDNAARNGQGTQDNSRGRFSRTTNAEQNPPTPTRVPPTRAPDPAPAPRVASRPTTPAQEPTPTRAASTSTSRQNVAPVTRPTATRAPQNIPKPPEPFNANITTETPKIAGVEEIHIGDAPQPIDPNSLPISEFKPGNLTHLGTETSFINPDAHQDIVNHDLVKDIKIGEHAADHNLFKGAKIGGQEHIDSIKADIVEKMSHHIPASKGGPAFSPHLNSAHGLSAHHTPTLDERLVAARAETQRLMDKTTADLQDLKNAGSVHGAANNLVGNTFGLGGKALEKVNELYENNLKTVLTGTNHGLTMEEWIKNMGNRHASDFLKPNMLNAARGFKDSAINQTVIYLNRLQELSELKPKSGLLGFGKEDVAHYIARALQKIAAKPGVNIDDAKFKIE